MNCLLCLKHFEDITALQLHIIDCRQIQCANCNQIFSKKSNLKRHLKLNRCNINVSTQVDTKDEQIANTLGKLEERLEEKLEKKLEKKFEKIAQDVAELKEKPNVTNNNLQVICVGSQDNYLDMLTERLGDFTKALECIKDCALSNLTGDCNLIEKIYFNQSENQEKPMRFMDKNRNFIEYYNEKKEKVRDTKELFGKKLANNLQNSYLKGVNYLINRNLETRSCPLRFLEEYDLQLWNQHIYELSNPLYQKKIINNIKI